MKFVKFVVSLRYVRSAEEFNSFSVTPFVGERLNFVLELCGFPNCLDVGKGRILPHAA